MCINYNCLPPDNGGNQGACWVSILLKIVLNQLDRKKDWSAERKDEKKRRDEEEDSDEGEKKRKQGRPW